MPDIRSFEPIWPNWVIDEVIGRGSFGTVYKAHREDRYAKIIQNAAVKHISIHSEAVRDEMDEMSGLSRTTVQKLYDRELEQLVKEIQAMVKLRGLPHIVAYEEHQIVRKPEGMGYDLFLRMELLTSLPSHVRNIGSMSREEVLRLGVHMLRALETLQSRKLIHRDIKPANIFIDAYGDYKLGDFGTARALQATGYASTRTGTPNYMAPEVYNGNTNYDQTVDIYSLGIVLYRYMNKGFLPFTSEEEMNAEAAIIRRAQGQPLQPPSQADEGLARVILKACAYRPRDRYQSAREMREALEALEQHQRKRNREVRVACVLEGSLREIQSVIEICPAGGETLIYAPQLPGYEAVGNQSARVRVDADGKSNEDKITFVYRVEQTVTAQSTVPVICRLKTGEEVFCGQAELKQGEITWVTAPHVPGYETAGEKWIPVRLEADGRTSPEVAAFWMQRSAPPPAPPGMDEVMDGTYPFEGKPQTQKKKRKGSAFWLIALLTIGFLVLFDQFGDFNIPFLSQTKNNHAVTSPPGSEQWAAVKATAIPTAPPTEAPTAPPTEAPTAPPAEAPTAPPTEAPTAPPTARPTVPVSPWDSVYRVGNSVYYGYYEQDNQRSSSEPIQWRVLAREGDKALLLSSYGLDSRLYQQQRENVTWESSDLRSWLNNSFYYTAFSYQEQQAIVTSALQNENNAAYGTRGGNITYDKVFLLSLNEARWYLGSDGERFGWVTEYAKANGAYRNKSTNAGWWWLRSPGDEQARAACISSKGPVDDVGNGVNVKGGLIRPAIWVDINALP